MNKLPTDLSSMNIPTNKLGEHFGFALILIKSVENAREVQILENIICALYLPLTYRNKDIFLFLTLEFVPKQPVHNSFLLTLRKIIVVPFTNKAMPTKELSVWQICHFCGLNGETIWITKCSRANTTHKLVFDPILNFNARVLRISTPLIYAQMEVEPLVAVQNAKRGGWKYLLETVLMVIFPMCFQ